MFARHSPGNVGSVGYLFVSSVKGVGVAFVVSPKLLLISVDFKTMDINIDPFVFLHIIKRI